ncbi:diacylglycerol/lipid kinase family protein [Neobacillus thermocopriae]|uniref:diacylglycerol/lipid kinase family protein n=1 Tax=Neobacillus thermocopriae TaxID=1215031 RepID=UPI00376FFC10
MKVDFMQEIYFIINPSAGNGRCLNIWQKIEQTLIQENIHFHAFFTEYRGHATKIASQIAVIHDHPKLVIAVGGDGTLHEVLNGIKNHKNIKIGLIPGGSGNDFSREFQIPQDPLDALKVLLRLRKDRPAFIDIGKIMFQDGTEHYFINNMGAGFDALVAYKVNHSKVKSILNKLGFGRLVYVYFLLKELFLYKTNTIDLMIDGTKSTFKQTWFVTVSNQPYYGGGMKIAPDAAPDDGLLDITVVYQLSRLKLLLVFMTVFWGKHIHFKEVKTFRGKTIKIQSRSTMFVHGDGEFIGYTPLHVDIQCKGIQILTRRQPKEEADWKARDTYDIH